MEFIEHAGNQFALGCFERTAPIGSVKPCLSDALPLVNASQWQPRDFSAMVPDPGLQGTHGACVAFQGGGALETARQIAGLKKAKLSKWKLYAEICNGRDEGANGHDCLKAISQNGMCLDATVPAFTLDANAGGNEALSEQQNYRADESFDCPDRASIGTSLQFNYPTPFALEVYSNFTALQQVQGRVCVPRPAGRFRGGHFVLGCGLDYFDLQWWIKFSTRSWGCDFGDQGCAYYPLNWISDTYADAWCIRSCIFYEGIS